MILILTWMTLWWMTHTVHNWGHIRTHGSHVVWAAHGELQKNIIFSIGILRTRQEN